MVLFFHLLKELKPDLLHTRKNYIYQIFIVCLVLTLASCTDAIRQTFEAVPRALGMTSEIVVITDESNWEGEVGDSIRYYYGGAYPLLPQPEPMYDLRHFTKQELEADPLRKELRTYMIVADLSNTESATTKMVKADLGEERLRRALEDENFFSMIGREKWAKGQLVIYIFGKDEEALKKNLVRGFTAVAKRVNQHDYNQLDASVYIDGESFRIAEAIKEKFDFDIQIPGSYQIAMNRDNFMWIRRDDRETTSSIMITTLPYRNTNQFTKENLISIQDSLGARFISTSELGSYMVTNDEDLPVFVYEKKIDGQYAIEGRGIWEMRKDFMGGPFSSYMILDQAKNRIIFIEGFIYAPSKKKRLFIQAIEHIVGTISLSGV